MKIIKSLKLVSCISIVLSPIVTVSCGGINTGGIPLNYSNDFYMLNIHSNTGYDNIKNSFWGNEYEESLREKGFDPVKDTIWRHTSNNNKFDIDFVENLLSSEKNIITSFPPFKSVNAAVHETVPLITDFDSSVMSILYNDGSLIDIEDIYNKLSITGTNPDLNQYILNIANDNASIEVNGTKKQIGMPYDFSFTGLTFNGNIDDEFNTLYEEGVFDDFTINNTLIPNIVTHPYTAIESIQKHITSFGWSWNEMMSLANCFIEHHPDDYFVPLMDRGKTGTESFVSANRYTKDGTLMWQGISDNWDSDIITELAQMNSLSTDKTEEIIDKVMELSAPWIDGEQRYVYGNPPAVFEIATRRTTEMMPMPLYTNNGYDMYDDLVLISHSLYVPDDQQFFSSERGVEFRDYIMELLLLHSMDDNVINHATYSWVTPYISTATIEEFRREDAMTDNIIDIMLSNTQEHSIASTRWLSDWYRTTLNDSVKWSGESNNRTYSYTFNPSESTDRNIDIYDKYNLNKK